MPELIGSEERGSADALHQRRLVLTTRQCLRNAVLRGFLDHEINANRLKLTLDLECDSSVQGIGRDKTTKTHGRYPASSDSGPSKDRCGFRGVEFEPRQMSV